MNCSVDECDRPVRARGLCPTHYAKRDEPNGLAPIRAKLEQGTAEKILGLTLPRSTAAQVRRAAKKARSSEHAVIVDVLERWASRQ